MFIELRSFCSALLTQRAEKSLSLLCSFWNSANYIDTVPFLRQLDGSQLADSMKSLCRREEKRTMRGKKEASP